MQSVIEPEDTSSQWKRKPESSDPFLYCLVHKDFLGSVKAPVNSCLSKACPTVCGICFVDPEKRKGVSVVYNTTEEPGDDDFYHHFRRFRDTHAKILGVANGPSARKDGNLFRSELERLLKDMG